MAHTPGPWIGCGPSFGDPLPRFTTEIVTDLTDDDGSYTICMFDFAHYDDENEANARLIAAAPDLLNALQNVLDMVASGVPDLDAVIAGRAAIAKATNPE